MERILLLDADTGRFAAFAGVPSDGILRPLALSHDGRYLLFSVLEDGGRTMLLVLHRLADGHNRRLYRPDGYFDVLAAVAPDGRTVATLSDDDDEVVCIDLVDLEALTRRRAWSGAGGASLNEAVIAWSPSGDMVAATYYLTHIDGVATVIVNVRSGAVLRHYERRAIVGCTNGSWVDDHHVILVDEPSEEFSPPADLVDVRDGSTRRLHSQDRWRNSLAIVDGRFLSQMYGSSDLYLTDLDGNDAELLLTVAAGLDLLDIAPEALARLDTGP
ncbi:TolB family protein [Luedemannella flava]|uniref:TolB family protein n=1 Tax=Luedemannella flava TaxID=349316 RepID=UPI0031D455A4